MKELKYLQHFFMLLFVGFALCAMQACGDDEEDEPVQKPNEEETVKPDDGKEEEKPSDKPSDTMEAVDLGLPSGLKWATCNVGASKPEEYGDYYAWGETTTKNDYSWETYKWCKEIELSTDFSITKYCIDIYGIVDNKTVLDPEDDVAHVKWGGSWRMPTTEEINELDENCTWKWTTYNGVNGQLVTGSNGNSIFLPAAGYREGTYLNSRGWNGEYWSATLSDERSYFAYYLGFGDSNGCVWDIIQRYFGYTVRPVTE